MKTASLLLAALLAAASAGCAHGEAAPTAREVAALRTEIQGLRRDRDQDRRRLELLEAQLAARSAGKGGSGSGKNGVSAPALPSPSSSKAPEARAAGYQPPRDLAVVRLAPQAAPTPPAPQLEEPEDDSFIFIVDGGDGSPAPAARAAGARIAAGGPTGGPDSAPPIATEVELREPDALAGDDGYESGLASLARGDVDDAVSLLERFLSQHARDGRADNAGLALGDAYRKKQLPGRALQAYERVATDYPAGDAVPDALLRYGETCLSLGRGAAARAAFERLIETHPGTDAATRAGTYLADR